jgi:hypothetical protein
MAGITLTSSNRTHCIWFEALTAVIMKSTVFWDITPCSPLSVKWHPAYRLLSRWFLARLILPWRWSRYVPPKRRLTMNGLHGVISQKIELFKMTAFKTSDPLCRWVRPRNFDVFTRFRMYVCIFICMHVRVASAWTVRQILLILGI